MKQRITLGLGARHAFFASALVAGFASGCSKSQVLFSSGSASSGGSGGPVAPNTAPDVYAPPATNATAGPIFQNPVTESVASFRAYTGTPLCDSGACQNAGTQGAAIPALPSPAVRNWVSAPDMTGVQVTPRQTSALVTFPAVPGAKEYRVIILPNEASVINEGSGAEKVVGGLIYCGGTVQRPGPMVSMIDNNATAANQLKPVYFESWRNLDSRGLIGPNSTPVVPRYHWTTGYALAPITPAPLRMIEVPGIRGPATAWVEALDRPCPFPGIIGRSHTDVVVGPHNPDVDSVGNAWLDVENGDTFPVVSESDVLARYGSLIFNGQGHDEGSPLGKPATPSTPKVLARAQVTLVNNTTRTPMDFFDDFSDESDMFRRDTSVTLTAGPQGRNTNRAFFKNSKWNYYTYNYAASDVFVRNGELRTILSDWEQDVFGQNSLYPRRAVHVNGTNYLHVTFEVQSNASARRYWLFNVCGPQDGAVFGSKGELTGEIQFTPFFYQNTGLNPSVKGWNCLQVFNRDGGASGTNEGCVLGGADEKPIAVSKLTNVFEPVYSFNGTSEVLALKETRPMSDLMVFVNKALSASELPERVTDVNAQVASGSGSVIHVAPKQYETNLPAWYFAVDSQLNAKGTILGDQNLQHVKTKFDFYVRNNRVVMYVNGQQRMCNDFDTPATRLSMGEAAIGLHQLMYHSSGEQVERHYANYGGDRTAQVHYRNNTPFIDDRSWANAGFRENTTLPAGFDATQCYSHFARGAAYNER